MSSKQVHRVGILGCGDVFARYAVGLRRYPELEVVRVGDVVPDRAKEAAGEYGYPAYGDADSIFADDSIEIVVNLTPPKYHAATVVRALGAGKHVYVEKPLATTLEDGRRVLEASASTGCLVGAAPDTFLGDAGQTARRALDDGLIGEPLGASAFIRHGRVETRHRDPRFFFQPGGGPAMDLGPYYFATLVNCLGPISSVAAAGRVGAPQRKVTAPERVVDLIDVSIPTHLSAIINFSCGVIGTAQMSFDVWDTELPWLEVYGTEGTLSFADPDRLDGEVRVRRHEDVDWRVLPPVLPAVLTHTKNEQFRRGFGVRDLANALEGGPHRTSAVFAFHVLEVLCSTASGAQEPRVVKIASTCERPQPIDVTVDRP
ncbi:MAG TPA: Gfo/Idh/MocA family oxidoreductase [Acidimicrobiales bacterium]|nr:Gfo/Idh/MocA family oxidoreductase [Acidimicrobiales bacterium]